MLKENPGSRPNIYQVLREACLMQNIEIPIRDVCLCPQYVRIKLTSVDIRQENPIRNKAKSTTADARAGSLPPYYWGCILPSYAAKAGNS